MLRSTLMLAVAFLAATLGLLVHMTTRGHTALAQSLPVVPGSTPGTGAPSGPLGSTDLAPSPRPIPSSPVGGGRPVPYQVIPLPPLPSPTPYPTVTLPPLPSLTLTPSPTGTPELPHETGVATRDDPSSRAGVRPPSPQGQRAAELALTLVGKPYAWAGASLETGFDCSGLVFYVYRQLGVTLERDTFTQWNNGRPVPKTELQAGDIVFFENTYTEGISHNGIYVGNGRFVHAVDESAGVLTSSLTDAYWAPRFAGGRRIF